MSIVQDPIPIKSIELPDIPAPTVTSANLKTSNRKPGRVRRVVSEGEQCNWVYGRGDKKDKRCEKPRKGEGNYCGTHYKAKGSTQELIAKSEDLTDEELCNWVFKRGDLKNTRCTKPKNSKGDYCNEHRSRRSLSSGSKNESCEWVCKKGKNKGERCTTRLFEGSIYCSTHYKLQCKKLAVAEK